MTHQRVGERNRALWALVVVELGCGTAFLAAALARSGARVVGLDASRAQLATARRCQAELGPMFPLVEADAEAVPVRSAAFDLVVSEYGASPWCDPTRWVPEAARILRPGGRLVFLTSSPLAGMCVPEAGGVAGDRLLRAPADARGSDYYDVATVEWARRWPAEDVWVARLAE